MRCKNPCKHCRKRRRKCIYEEYESSCQMCAQIGIPCVPSRPNEAIRPVRDGNEQLQSLRDQITGMETDMDTLEEVLDVLPQQLSKHDNDNHVPLSWKLSVQNGRIQLESRIETIEELLLYNQASIQYLSPLHGLFKREHMLRFESVSVSIAVASTGIVARHIVNSRQSNHIRRITYNNPTYDDVYYRAQIDRLVPLYLDRYNCYVGLIHGPTFLEYYRHLEDPLSSPITLAVCIDAISYFYPQLESPLEMRQVAEFFYQKCRDALLDMYDDPNHRLEAIIVTTLLTQYLPDVLLEYAEARRLVTIALLVCHDLKESRQRFSVMEKVMLNRHWHILQAYECYFTFILDGTFDFSALRMTEVEETVMLDDEPDMMRQYITSWRNVIQLVASPYINAVMQKLSGVVHGHCCELSLDMILQYEDVVRDWWSKLPKESRICEDPFIWSPVVQQAVDEAHSSTEIIPFAFLHALTALVQSSMLKPRILSASEDIPYASGSNDDSNIIHVLRENAISRTLQSTQVLVHVLKKTLEIDIEAIPLSFSYMIVTFHSACNVVNYCKDARLPENTRETLRYCFEQLSSLVPRNHQVPSNVSFLEAFITRFMEPCPLEVYETYPMPGYAFLSEMFDVCYKKLRT
ncbi:hypothetical protein BJV82DRAFT_227776 [Fennellomyces sp. T-0311]|nr:hypothetical protein BJV82DRAFT_227776 [Fennellomyces sp. T-0311]